MRIKELLRKEIEDKRAKNISDLSRKIGLPSTTLREIYKTGGENIKVPTLIKIAQYLNVSTDYLLGMDLCTSFIDKKDDKKPKTNENVIEFITESAFDEIMEDFISEFRDRIRQEYTVNGGNVEWSKREEVVKDPFIDIEMVGVDK